MYVGTMALDQTSLASDPTAFDAPNEANAQRVVGLLRELRHSETLGARATLQLQESEARTRELHREISTLREELTRTRRAPAPAAIPRPIAEFLDAPGTLAAWTSALHGLHRDDSVRIACFTFDLGSIVNGLLRARDAECLCMLVFSQRDSHITRNQSQALQRLRAAGVRVRGYHRARLHAKVMIVSTGEVSEVIVGSTNFTGASQANVERNVRLSSVPAATLAGEIAWYDSVFDAAVDHSEGLGTRIPATPPR